MNLSIKIIAAYALGAITMLSAVETYGAVHKVEAAGKKFKTPTDYAITSTENPIVKNLIDLANIGSAKNDKAPMRISVGIRGDKNIKKYQNKIPSLAEAYYISIRPNTIIVAGNDENGLRYGLQSLSRLMANDSLMTCEITESPDVPYRGVVEGFYGTPWSHEARLSMLKFMSEHRMNSYLYGPKDDAYHRSKWAEPYPAEEGAQIAELAKEANDNGVNFYWAIHPGADIKWDGSERNRIVNKFNLMYDLGVRSFAVFFDDIVGDGTRADKQADLLNYIQEEFINKKHDVSPLVMCPTKYTQVGNEKDHSYLTTLKENLLPEIKIMWTGKNVMSDIDKETMDWVNTRIGRNAFIWWNFPVTDYIRNKLLLGPAYGISTDIASDLSGFVVNPMEFPEASKIAIASVADYLWEMNGYDPLKAWKAGISEVCPGAPEAFEIFAAYNQAALPNWQNYDRIETPDLASVSQRALNNDANAIAEIAEKCGELKRASLMLLVDRSNENLINEIRPWLEQAINISDYGQLLCEALLDPRLALDPKTRDLIDAMRIHIADYEKNAKLHPTQTGISLGSAVLMPTLSKMHAKIKGIDLNIDKTQKGEIPDWQVLTE